MKLFADYRQIHVLSPEPKGDLAAAWTAKATEDRVAVAGDIVGIGTEQVDDVDVKVEILEHEPDLLAGDHVTEASIVLPGEVVVMGCTDYLPDAKRWSLAPGTWRLRATHTHLAKRERIKIQLWMAKKAGPRVLTRWKPERAIEKVPKGKPKTRKQAVAAALRGEIDVALEVLRALHEAGDAAASASCAEIFAFQGRMDEMARCAKALLAKPDAVYAGNVSDDMRALVKVKAGKLSVPRTEAPNRARFDEAVREAPNGKRFKGKPLDLARHCFALAVVFHVDDEIIARWDPDHPYLHFDQAVDVARALARKKQPRRAWEILESRLGRWYPVDAAQVLPVVLITDALLAPLMTRERRELVLRTPRAV